MSTEQDPNQKPALTRGESGLSEHKQAHDVEAVEVQETLSEEQWAIAERICRLVEENPKGLDFICKSEEGLVSARTFHRWLEADIGLRQRYARAKERQAEFLVFQAIEIADDQKGDTIIGERGLTQDAEWVSRARLRVDTRKWLAGKLNPKKWGDKLEVEQSGEVKHTISFKR